MNFKDSLKKNVYNTLSFTIYIYSFIYFIFFTREKKRESSSSKILFFFKKRGSKILKEKTI